MADQADKAKEKKKEAGAGATRPTAAAESELRSGNVLNEARTAIDGHAPPPVIPSPGDVFSVIAPSDMVGQAACEAMAGFDWDDVASVASIAMLPVDESYSLVTAYREGTSEFFHEWRDVVARSGRPGALSQGSFRTLSEISLDEGVVPVLVGMCVRALQVAGPEVASCVEDAYPDLGRTVYGPAGDPRRGPDLAKSYMSPYPAGTDSPSDGDPLMTTRMFSDPDEREKERASRLSDVVDLLNNMRSSADDANVNPEGMFLNTYRDMWREKVRYS